jgi:23S rRNA pseudouridine1911/1915/1917 synthase
MPHMSAIANNSQFKILAEATDHIVVCKPAPLKVHPNAPDGVETLYDALRSRFAYEIANGWQISIVNRLDRETSGVTLVATTAAAARRFGLAMMARQAQKTYLAIAHGWPSWTQITETGPILRRGEIIPSEIYVKQIVHPEGSPCETTFRLLECRTDEEGRPFSLIEASPHTGRMHQIRVHLSHLGYPIVGDKLYGQDEQCYLDFIATGWTPDLQRRLILPRQALHSCRLEITDDAPLHWSSPLPDDLAQFWENLSPRHV